MSIEKDDLHSHRKLGADLMKMEREAAIVALFPEMVRTLELCEQFFLREDYSAAARDVSSTLSKVKELQK